MWNKIEKYANIFDESIFTSLLETKDNELLESKLLNNLICKLDKGNELNNEEIQYLCSKRVPLNTKWNNDYFQCVCQNGHLEVAKWLYSLGGVNIHASNDYAFIYSCGNGHLEVVKWLKTIK